MTKEYRAKTFKSGNSVALRLPKALGVEPGREMRVREDHGSFIFEPAEEAPRRIDVSKFWGKAPWLRPLSAEDREFEERELDWEGKLLKRDG